MFIKVTQKANGRTHSFRVMESIRQGSRAVQKTLRFVGSSSDPDVIRVLKKLLKICL